MNSPLATTEAFHIGFIPISATVVTTWGLMAVLAFGAFLATRRLTLAPGPRRLFSN